MSTSKTTLVGMTREDSANRDDVDTVTIEVSVSLKARYSSESPARSTVVGYGSPTKGPKWTKVGSRSRSLSRRGDGILTRGQPHRRTVAPRDTLGALGEEEPN